MSARRGSDSSAAVRYRQFERDGWQILVGKGARDNDRLTFEVAERSDLWMHVSGWSGSHVVVRLPDGAGEPPREVVDYAARLAAWFSKARGARGKVEVHLCRAGDVSKERRSPAGQVQLTRWTAIKVYAKQAPAGVEESFCATEFASSPISTLDMTDNANLGPTPLMRMSTRNRSRSLLL